MKNVNTVLNVITLIAVIVLFVLFFRSGTPAAKPVLRSNDSTSATVPAGTIAFFEMDTVELRYNYIKDVQEQLKKRQQAITDELDAMKKNYMSRVTQLQNKAPTMSQQEGEAAQAEINEMQQNLQQKEAHLTQQLQEMQFKLMQDINKKIENFLRTYNIDKGYSYILSHSTGDFIYFKDSAFNITQDIVKGLNDSYKKPVEKK